MLVEQVHGHTQDKPTVIGEPNGEPAIQVYATGLYEGIRKGVLRWVTGTKVAPGLRAGVIVRVGDISPESAAQVDAEAELEAASRRDHVESPPGAMFEPRTPTTTADLPVPEAGDTEVKLADMSKQDLLVIARAMNLEGRSAMDKSELYDHLRKHPDIAKHIDHLD